jgi:hypothetical protein
MGMILGMLCGGLVRLLVSFLGGSKLEGMITALIIMSGASPEFVLGFCSTWIGLKGMSIPMDTLQPVNVMTQPYLLGYITQEVSIGEAPKLIRQIYSLELYMSWLVMGAGLFFLPAIWGSGGSGSKEFISIVMGGSPLVMSFIWLSSIYKSERKIPYIICMILVGFFGLFITESGIGQFSVLIVISMMFFGWEGLSTKKLPEQNWNYEGGSNLEFEVSSIGVGVMSACFIGCPSSPLVKLMEDEYDPAYRKFYNHVVASKVSEITSLFLWFYFGASRGVESDVLDKTVTSLLDNYNAVFGFIAIILICQYLTWNYLDLIGKLNWVWSKFLCPIKLLNMAISLITVLFYIPLGMPALMIPIAMGMAIFIRMFISKMKVESTVAISMVSIIPLFGLWL